MVTHNQTKRQQARQTTNHWQFHSTLTETMQHKNHNIYYRYSTIWSNKFAWFLRGSRITIWLAPWLSRCLVHSVKLWMNQTES